MAITILNLTQHKATPAQLADGIVDVHNTALLSNLLTVQIGGAHGYAAHSRETRDYLLEGRVSEIISEFVTPELVQRAERLCQIPVEVKGVEALNQVRNVMTVHVMIAGFAPLMKRLEERLKALGCRVHVALSDRVSREETLPDGTVKKVNEFVHMGLEEL